MTHTLSIESSNGFNHCLTEPTHSFLWSASRESLHQKEAKMPTLLKDIENRERIFTELLRANVQTFHSYSYYKNCTPYECIQRSNEYLGLALDFLLRLEKLPCQCQVTFLNTEAGKQLYLCIASSHNEILQAKGIEILRNLSSEEKSTTAVLQVLQYQQRNQNFGLSLGAHNAKKETHQHYLRLLATLAKLPHIDGQELFTIISFQGKSYRNAYKDTHYGLLLAQMEDIDLLSQYLELLTTLHSNKNGKVLSQQLQGLLLQKGLIRRKRTHFFKKCFPSKNQEKTYNLAQKINLYPQPKKTKAKKLFLSMIHDILPLKLRSPLMEKQIWKELLKPDLARVLIHESTDGLAEKTSRMANYVLSLSIYPLSTNEDLGIVWLNDLSELISSENYGSAIDHIHKYSSVAQAELEQLYYFFNTVNLTGLIVKLLTFSLLTRPSAQPHTTIAIAQEIIKKSAICTEDSFQVQKFAERTRKEAKQQLQLKNESLLPVSTIDEPLSETALLIREKGKNLVLKVAFNKK